MLCPRKRWDNKAPRTLVFISGSRYSTGCCAPAFAGWQVRRFPVEKGGAVGTKGGKRPKAANHRHAIPADESKGIQLEPAGSRKLEADCLPLYIQRPFPAHWYLIAFLSYASRTEILRLRLRMTMRAGREARNVGSFLRKELPDRAEDRSVFWLIELTLLSSVAYGAPLPEEGRLWLIGMYQR